MSIDAFKNLWDGSESGWTLEHFIHVECRLIFYFDEGGPTQEEIVKLRKVVPEFANEKLELVYRKLKGVARYTTEEYPGNNVADELEVLSQEMNLRVTKEYRQFDSYMPINGESAMIIEDDELARKVAEKMIAAGVKVIEARDK